MEKGEEEVNELWVSRMREELVIRCPRLVTVKWQKLANLLSRKAEFEEATHDMESMPAPNSRKLSSSGCGKSPSID
jgi:hypothetical protein